MYRQPQMIKGRPKIIYTSRTHSQLTQVIDELKSTPYYPRIALIGSRDHMCIHKDLSELKGNALNVACNKAVKGGYNGVYCNMKGAVERYFESEKDTLLLYNNLISNSPEFKNGKWKIQDIEELHVLGRSAQVCPYFLQKERAKHADLILMPYQYLIDEKIRENFEIDYKNSVVIVDEAHNIGSVCEEVSSMDITDSKLTTMSTELFNLKKALENREFMEKNFSK